MSAGGWKFLEFFLFYWEEEVEFEEEVDGANRCSGAAGPPKEGASSERLRSFYRPYLCPEGTIRPRDVPLYRKKIDKATQALLEARERDAKRRRALVLPSCLCCFDRRPSSISPSLFPLPPPRTVLDLLSWGSLPEALEKVPVRVVPRVGVALEASAARGGGRLHRRASAASTFLFLRSKKKRRR